MADGGATEIQINAATAYNESRGALGKHSKKMQTTFLDLAERAAEKGAQKDHLTGLLNRAGMEAQTQKQIKVLERQSSGIKEIDVLVIDLNRFKKVNDGSELGHNVGDEVLSLTAKVLTSTAKRDTDTVGRYGGDELLIVSIPANPGSTGDKLPEKIISLMDKVREQLKRKYPSLPDGSATLSIGRATLTLKEIKELQRVNPDKSLLELIIPKADKAMYKAKQVAHRTNQSAFVFFRTEDFQKDTPLSLDPLLPVQE